MPEVFGHKPSRAAFQTNQNRQRSFDKIAEPVRSTALLADVNLFTNWIPPLINLWQVPTVSIVLQTGVTDTDLWELPAGDAPCFRYVGGQSIWVQLEYSGWVRRATGGTLPVTNFLIYSIGMNVGLGVPAVADVLASEHQQVQWGFQDDYYAFNFAWHGLVVPDTYIAPMFFQWIARTDTVYLDMNFSVLATRSEHG